jgi:beta-lactamase superfamily II metal-dependent hydrolase
MKYSLSIFSALICLNVFCWYWVATGGPDSALNLFFLKVGEGDSELAVLPGGVKVLIDGGPGVETLRSLDASLAPTDRYIDMVILSHPQLDHFGGLVSILERYKVGIFIWNGEIATEGAWKDLENILKSQNIPAIVMGNGDIIRFGVGTEFDILSPMKDSHSTDPNDDSLIVRLKSAGTSTLFTGDATGSLEQTLASAGNIKSDILKVSHHGSKTSSIASFLSAVLPRIAVVEVGTNTYGHPTPEALRRLANVGVSIYRTDNDGTVHVRAKDGLLTVATYGQ